MEEKYQILNYLDNNEVKDKEVLIDFLSNSNNIYSRSNLFGHITGSAFIVNNDMDEGLLILHKKYNKLLSPGGHVDEEETAKMASVRETGEEVGLNKLELLMSEIFDIDIHKIPAGNKNGIVEPEHYHFDIRYIYKANKDAVINLNLFEAKGFEWNKLTELAKYPDESIKRQSEKAISLIDKLKVKKKNKLKNY